MPEHTRTGEGPLVINDAARFDLKTVVMIVGVAVSVGVSWTEQKFSLFRVETALRAEVVDVKAELEKTSDAADRTQDGRLTALENRLGQIQETNCAIAKKLQVPTVGCGRGDDR